MKLPTNTILTIISAFLLTLSVAIPAPDPIPFPDINADADAAAIPRNLGPELELAPRQAASARITNLATFSGTGCPSGSVTFTINAQQNSISINFANFIVVVPAPSSTTTLTCNLAIQMTFPRACLSIPSTTARYFLFGRFGPGVTGGLDSTYTITSPGRIINDNNSPRRFSGTRFEDGEALTVDERVGIQFNTSVLVTNARFGLGILDAVTAGAGVPAGGRFQIQGVTWTLGTQNTC